MGRLCIIIGFSLTVVTAAQAPTWATSWEAFAKAIAPYVPRSDSYAEEQSIFDAKSIVWEGTVSKEAEYVEDEMFDMEMTPQTLKIADSQVLRSVDVRVIRVKVKKGSPMYIVLGEGHDAALIFKVDDAEPILRGP